MTAPEDPNLPMWARRAVATREVSDEQLAAFIGPKWEKSYRRKLEPFREDASFVPTWNWPAALVAPFWMLYRKLFLGFLLWFLASIVVGSYLMPQQAPESFDAFFADPRALIVRAAITLSFALATGGSGNWLLYRRARAASKLVAAQELPSAEGRALLARLGGVNKSGPIFLLVLNGALALMQLFVSSGTR